MTAPENILRYFNEYKSYTDSRTSAGIEAYRKGYARLRFTDGEGKTLKNVRCEVKQTSHKFKYGANIFLLDELETPEKNAEYRERFAGAFNLATLPFYWCDLEPEDGKPRFSKDSPKRYRRPAPDLCLEYCRERGIMPKAHCLNYDAYTPNWLGSETGEVKRRLDRRFRELAERYADEIEWWEVINETLCGWNVWKERHNTKFFFEPDVVEWSFKCAEKYFGGNKLIINEADHIWFNDNLDRGPYFSQIERAILRGARIDSVGLQNHMWALWSNNGDNACVRTLCNPRRIFAMTDLYERLNLPLQITEITVPSNGWSEENEAVQAEILKNLIPIWFSVRQMEAFIYWNLVDGYAFGAEPGDMTKGENTMYGGLLRFDMTPKPAYRVLTDYFNKIWHTDELLDAEDGQAEFRGFLGGYNVTAVFDGKTITKHFNLTSRAYNDITVQLI